MIRHHLVPRRSAAFTRRLPSLFGDFLSSDLSDFDRLFDEFWRAAGVARHGSGAAAAAPRMDYSETDDEIRLRAEMPGLEEQDIEVSLEEGVLSIQGTRAEKREEQEDGNVRHVETWRGSFQRAVRLPAEVDEDAIVATYKNGVLSVTLPKRAEAKPEVRSIPVTTS